jgi:hypothetical protein
MKGKWKRVREREDRSSRRSPSPLPPHQRKQQRQELRSWGVRVTRLQVDKVCETTLSYFLPSRYIIHALAIGRLGSLSPQKQGVCHTVALLYTLKSSLRQTKKYRNSNISPCKNSSKRDQNPSRYYNSIINLKFQHKPKYHLSKILISK